MVGCPSLELSPEIRMWATATKHLAFVFAHMVQDSMTVELTPDQLLKVVPSLTRAVFIDLTREKRKDGAVIAPLKPALHRGSPRIFGFGEAMLFAVYGSIRPLGFPQPWMRKLMNFAEDLKKDERSKKHRAIPRLKDQENPFSWVYSQDETQATFNLNLCLDDKVIAVQRESRKPKGFLVTNHEAYRIQPSGQLEPVPMTDPLREKVLESAATVLRIDLHKIHFRLKKAILAGGFA